MDTAFRSEGRFSQEQFLDWLQQRPAADINHYELIGGRIVSSPPAGWPHGSVEAVLIARLESQARKLGRVLGSSAGYELPTGDTLEPDVSFISNERFAQGPRPVFGRSLRIVPNLVVEILSPSTAERDRTEKLEIYARNGVEEYWLVDPLRREVTVLARAGSAFGPPRVVTAGRVSSRVLPDLQLEVEPLFADLV